jgi:hypothetical protein
VAKDSSDLIKLCDDSSPRENSQRLAARSATANAHGDMPEPMQMQDADKIAEADN